MVFGLPAAQTAGLVMLLGLLPVLPAIWYIWDLREKPGVLWFIVALVAGGFWSLTAGLNPFIANPDVTMALFNVRFFVISVGAICWLLLATEYTLKRHVSTRLFLLLVAFPVVTQLLLWTNHVHELVYTTEAGIGETNTLSFTPEFWWYADTGYNYLLVLIGAGMWVSDLLSARGERRRQTALLLASTAILLIGAILFTSGVLEPLDPTPLAFILAGLLIAYALFNYQLFQVTPVAHQRALEEMDEAVVIIDSEDHVVETNPAARALFGTDEEPTGRDVEHVFGAFPTLLDYLEDAYTLQAEVQVPVGGGERYFDLNVTPIEEGRDMRGRVVVLRDITSLKQREEELDLAKQVLTRVFRHNVRNDMTAIRGYAEVIEERTTGDVATYAGEILDTGDRLLDQSQKARFIEDVIDTSDDRVTVSLATVVEDVLDSYRRAQPDVTFEVDVPDVEIVAHANVDTAIEQAVENAIEHHDGVPTVTIEAMPGDEWVVLAIEDDGPGIPSDEIETVLDEEETALKHGSGIGLWLLHWIVTNSGGELVLENTSGGARVEMHLQRPNKHGHGIE